MELSIVYLALFTLIGEASNLSSNSNEILGLVTIIFMLLGQLIMFALIILEILRLITCGVLSCFKKKTQVDSKSSVADKMGSDISEKHVYTTSQTKQTDHDFKAVAESYFNQKQDLNKTNQALIPDEAS